MVFVKKASKNELNIALKTIINGSNYYSETVIKTLANDLIDKQTEVLTIHESLTNREIEIIKLIAQEMTGAGVAEILNFSTQTVASHRKNIFHKLNINSIYALIKYAIEHRLI